MQKQFFGSKREILLEANFDIDRALVFLPGISGKAHSERFSGLVKIAEDAGYACARVALWDDEDDVQKENYESLFLKLDGVMESLKRIGFIDVALVGKSFGGGVALAYEHEMVSQKILWAPAIGYEEGKGNFEVMQQVQLSDVSDLLDIHLGSDGIKKQSASIDIIHGTEDTVIPLYNSKGIIAEVTEGSLECVDGADHSFKDSYHETKLLELTGKLLK